MPLCRNSVAALSITVFFRQIYFFFFFFRIFWFQVTLSTVSWITSKLSLWIKECHLMVVVVVVSHKSIVWSVWHPKTEPHTVCGLKVEVILCSSKTVVLSYSCHPKTSDWPFFPAFAFLKPKVALWWPFFDESLAPIFQLWFGKESPINKLVFGKQTAIDVDLKSLLSYRCISVTATNREHESWLSKLLMVRKIDTGKEAHSRLLSDTEKVYELHSKWSQVLLVFWNLDFGLQFTMWSQSSMMTIWRTSKRFSCWFF